MDIIEIAKKLKEKLNSPEYWIDPITITGDEAQMLIDYIEEKETLIELLKSDSVNTLLRYGVKSPSKSGMDNFNDDGYYDLYNISCRLRQPKTK